ncbi:MAG: hypothetical protein K0B10_09215 [Vicingaceae bacterium]|nr:hypothetical protein [Vicingaceae bacterium]
MKLLIYISILLLSVITTANAQFVKNNNLSKVEFYVQKNELDSAKKYIDIASKESQFINDTKTWFYKSMIYKELYKLKEKELLISPLRDETTTSLQQLLLVDTNKTYQSQTESLIKYISSTYYNDAARALTVPDIEVAKVNFKFYHTLISLSGMDKKVIQENIIQFKFALATAIGVIDEETALDSTQKETLKNIYTEILAIDEQNAAANYNLSLLYYNEGVDLANNIDYDSDFDELLEVQDKIASLFSNALPYMLKVYQLDYKKEDVLEGLKSIYRGLNDEEKSAYYENELKSIKK